MADDSVSLHTYIHIVYRVPGTDAVHGNQIGFYI